MIQIHRTDDAREVKAAEKRGPRIVLDSDGLRFVAKWQGTELGGGSYVVTVEKKDHDSLGGVRWTEVEMSSGLKYDMVDSIIEILLEEVSRLRAKEYGIDKGPPAPGVGCP